MSANHTTSQKKKGGSIVQNVANTKQGCTYNQLRQAEKNPEKSLISEMNAALRSMIDEKTDTEQSRSCAESVRNQVTSPAGNAEDMMK
ncbi:hypothetical protein Q1695_013778 [Nippostrongylus brasiliensis]|nr:hypothetical protein Q1695_013778 [Nippostrongylus brasiliensis]